jgi:hypothetical protein
VRVNFLWGNNPGYWTASLGKWMGLPVVSSAAGAWCPRVREGKKSIVRMGAVRCAGYRGTYPLPWWEFGCAHMLCDGYGLVPFVTKPKDSHVKAVRNFTA